MKVRTFNALAGSSLLLIASAATAQEPAATAAAAEATEFSLEEIVVTARRKDESIQDVPTTINAVTGAEIDKLNIKKFEDIAAVVPGLSMANNANGIGATASVRGVAYDVNASGNNGTVEFYLNDAPISAGNLFQTVYDVQQVELLRGPQGTLRGRASPSGSMTVTTHRPDLQEMGGFASATGTDIGGTNFQGAFGIPIISDVLAIRVAGVYDENEGSRVKSINSPTDPSSKSKSGRATVRFDPTDTLSFTLTYQKTKQDIESYSQVESQQVINPAAPVNPGAPGAPAGIPRFIKAEDRLAVQDAPALISQEFDNYNLQAQWAFLGQKLNYVGARNEQNFDSQGRDDVGDFFPSNYQPFLTGYGQHTIVDGTTTAHELRLSSEERIAGILDYVVGGFYQKLDSPTNLTIATPVFFGAPSPATPGLINPTPISRTGSSEEKSVFANLTVQLGAATELSGGVRYIEYHSEGGLSISGAPVAAAAEDSDFNATIYSVSLKHNFTDDLMVYASTGTSWRPGISVTGDFSIARSPQELAFTKLPPEESTSYEIGFKASALEKRLRYSVSAYNQKFDNYPYRAPSGVWFVEQLTPTFSRIRPFNFVGAVPVEVNGVEGDIAFAPTAAWDIGAVAAYSLGEIKNGFVPCNDYAPTDGIPDNGVPADVAAIRAATNGENVAGCTVSQRASLAPLWSGSLQSEYRVPLTSALNGFVSGLLSVYGDSKNDPTNSGDDYSSYALLNLYLGVRGGDGAWEVSLYGKNVTETERVLTRSSAITATSYNIGAAGQTGLTNYYVGTNASGLGMTAPREFGLTVRYAFGSK